MLLQQELTHWKFGARKAEAQVQITGVQEVMVDTPREISLSPMGKLSISTQGNKDSSQQRLMHLMAVEKLMPAQLTEMAGQVAAQPI